MIQIKNIVLYSTGCPKCRILKHKLDENGVQFEENNSIEEMKKMGVKMVPVLKVDDRLLDFAEAINWVDEQRQMSVEEANASN